ncbi:hypothetical protein MMC31_001466 [Peltigera leucophlebia]|nr:hypothetical protein [Peltigera leucophlebia]
MRTKRLKIKQDAQVVTRASKNAEAAIKQMATQELKAKKKGCKNGNNEVIEAQKQSFQTELERIREKFQLVELRSKKLEDEIKTLKAKKRAPEYSLAPSTPVVKDAQAMPSSLKIINGRKAVKPAPKSYAQIATANAAQNPSEKT